ncbi:uncharacterized protein LOC116350355 [Contarinia nasturtii]|uniref:uncharacterized protein LOC116350355 n=1 Tax=Contarinia nasturtii TaxID=265458 RepID=UPI0012D48EAB|nr:uncharacterized protein LOC116350355 [Contarinia nasturtii]
MTDAKDEIGKNAENCAAREVQNQLTATDVNQVAVVGSSINPSPIQKLEIDCLEELFEWLSIANLRVLRQTCKRLKGVVDYFIKSNYPSVQFGFGPIKLYTEKIYKLRELDSASRKLIKQITLWTEEPDEISSIRDILPQLERFEIGNSCQFHGDFYKSVLKWCTNLKNLSIRDIAVDKVIGDENDWLHSEYPLIKHIELDDSDIGGPGNAWEIPELKIFFEKNPQIQSFSTTFHFLWENRECYLDSNIKLDQLNIQGDCYLEHGMDRICGLLNTLYEQGFYRRVHMHASFIYEQEDWDQILSVRGMEKLYLVSVGIDIKFPPMSNLREFGTKFGSQLGDYETIAKNLVNVERIYFYQMKSDTFIPFMRFAPRVEEIKIDNLCEGIYFNDGIINLTALNEERKTLNRARKITIYVKENVFLATKWATKSTELDLITLKRIEATSSIF